MDLRPVRPRQLSSRASHGSYRSGFTFGILSFLSIAALALVSAIATARIYGVRIIGEFALVSAPVAVLWVLSTVKEQAALIKEITRLPPRHPRVSELFAAVFTFSAALTVATSAIAGVVCALVFAGPLHRPQLVAPMLASLAGYAFVTNTGWNVDSIFSAFVAGRQLFCVRIHETLAFLATAIALGFAWRSVWALVCATIVGSLSALVHRVLAVRPFVRMRLGRGGYRRGLRALPGLLRFGLKVTPGSVASGVSQQAGIWAVASVAPTSLVGAYSRAQTIPERLQYVNFRIVEVLYPTLVGRRANGDGDGFDRALCDTMRYALFGLLLIAAVLGGAAHTVLSVFGPGFSRAAPAFVLLMDYPALAAVNSAQTQALLAVDRPGLTSVAELIRLAVTISLTVALAPAAGIAAPAIALLAGFVPCIALKTAVLTRYLSHSLRELWPFAERVALLAAYAAGLGAAAGVQRAHPAPFVLLLLGLPLAGLVFVGVFIACGGANKRDRDRLTQAIARVRAWREGRRRQLEPAAT